MYLVARQESKALTLIDLLAKNGYTAKWLPLMTTKLNYRSYNQLKTTLACYNVIILPAPAAIDYLRDDFAKLDSKCKIIVMGKASALELSQYTNLQIIYPEPNTGIDALKQSGILNKYSHEQVLVIGGDKINPKLAKLLNDIPINYCYIGLYNRENIGLKHLDTIEKLISTPKIAGIIITSKEIASYLIECCTRLNLKEQLSKLPIISIHQQITDYLIKHGLTNCYQTVTSDNYSLLQLIRNLDNG